MIAPYRSYLSKSYNMECCFEMKEFTVKSNDADQRLDRFLTKTVPGLPSSLLQKYIRLKRIKVNGKGSKKEYRLCEGDLVECYINDEFFEKPRETDAGAHYNVKSPKLNIVYEDANILLVDKPAGMLAHSAGEWGENTLVANIQAYLRVKGEWRPEEENSFAPALCNRIDRNTSGIVIAVKNAASLRVMNRIIKDREIDKYYLCITAGKPPKPAGMLEGYIFKDAVKNRVYVRSSPEPGAKKAVTRYRILASKGELSLVECELVTGRTHQIRAQLAAAGCPLLGDGKYGREAINRKYGEKRQALCSYRLRFSFRSDADLLEYLNNREFRINNSPYFEKYFELSKYC